MLYFRFVGINSVVGSLYSIEAMCARNEKLRPSNVRCDTKTVNLHNDIASIAAMILIVRQTIVL